MTKQSFQSTRPSRGETDDSLFGNIADKVSIHSPLAGRDTKSLKALTGTTWFQSTRPSRGETYAPHAGTHSGKRFNPLAPRGARRRPEQNPTFAETFQSTRPSRGETHTGFPLLHGMPFQSTRPSRGETGEPDTVSAQGRGFNPLAPRGARLIPGGMACRAVRFNPLAPRGARHRRAERGGRAEAVSIHSPLAGRDSPPSRLISQKLLFQSTRPSRGETEGQWNIYDL